MKINLDPSYMSLPIAAYELSSSICKSDSARIEPGCHCFEAAGYK